MNTFTFLHFKTCSPLQKQLNIMSAEGELHVHVWSTWDASTAVTQTRILQKQSEFAHNSLCTCHVNTLTQWHTLVLTNIFFWTFAAMEFIYSTDLCYEYFFSVTCLSVFNERIPFIPLNILQWMWLFIFTLFYELTASNYTQVCVIWTCELLYCMQE